MIIMKFLNELKIVLTDCDGVLTDGGMYYYNNGVEGKKFNTRDGMAMKILKANGIKTGIITGENTKIVENRANKLKIDYLYMGVKNKYQILLEICEKENITPNNAAYIGDDINDLEILKNVGFSACPNDAMEEVKKICNFVSSKDGGKGVVRDVIERYLSDNE
ncbi:MAG: HAD-IIIA family hydrolase [Bacilli bacterium]|nr:HAD-IIIA family hydrolase [Bacilli bacterium]